VVKVWIFVIGNLFRSSHYFGIRHFVFYLLSLANHCLFHSQHLSVLLYYHTSHGQRFSSSFPRWDLRVGARSKSKCSIVAISIFVTRMTSTVRPVSASPMMRSNIRTNALSSEAVSYAVPSRVPLKHFLPLKLQVELEPLCLNLQRGRSWDTL